MPLLNAEVFIGLIRNFRAVHIAGRFGGGKTSLASWLSYEFIRRGYVRHAVANYPLSVATFPPPRPMANCVVVMDEAHQYVRVSKDIMLYMQNLRKYNIIYLMPAVYSPHPEFRRLSVKRLFNFYRVGFPGWLYQYQLRDGASVDKGLFLWHYPLRDIPGLYATGYSPTSDWSISYAMQENANDVKRLAMAQAEFLDVETEVGERLTVDADIADVTITESTETMVAAMNKR